MHSALHLTVHVQIFAAVDNVDDARGAKTLEILEERSRISAVCIGRVDALGTKVVELLKVGIHHNFLLVRILERLAALDTTATKLAVPPATAACCVLLALRSTRNNLCAPLEPRNIASQHIHQHRLGHIVGIVTGHNVVDAQRRGAAVEGLSAEHTAKGACVSAAYAQLFFRPTAATMSSIDQPYSSL